MAITLDKVGVFDNREAFVRGETGEVYLYVVITDGANKPLTLRFPQEETQHYKLEKDQVIEVNSHFYFTENVQDKLTVTFIGYEDDGEGFEQYVVKAIAAVIEMQAKGAVGAFLELFDFNLKDIMRQFMGAQDERLGFYEQTWDISTNWGIGQYHDVICQDERGIDCLRLWFTVSDQ